MDNIDLKDIEQYVELIKSARDHESKDPYTYSSLPDYFQLDTWTTIEGILLIAGINPDQALIDLTRYNDLGAKEEKVKINAAQPLDIIADIYDYPRLEVYRKDIEDLWSDLHDCRHKLASNPSLEQEERLSCRIDMIKSEIKDMETQIDDDDVKAVEHIREHYDHKIGRILKLWLSTTGHHENSNDQSLSKRYLKEYFLNWATEKNIEIKWLDWAIENNYHTDETTKLEHKEQPLDPRERTTWKNIVKTLCLELKLKIDKPYNAAVEIQRLAAKHGVEVPKSDDTIAKRLKELKED